MIAIFISPNVDYILQYDSYIAQLWFFLLNFNFIYHK